MIRRLLGPSLSNVVYLDVGQDSIHDLLAGLSEDAQIEGAFIVVKREGKLSVTGGNFNIGEIAIATLLIDEVAKNLILDG